jgi:hypothetical protein
LIFNHLLANVCFIVMKFRSLILLPWGGSYVTTIQRFRESKKVLLHNMDECLLGQSDKAVTQLRTAPSFNQQVCHADEGVGP